MPEREPNLSNYVCTQNVSAYVISETTLWFQVLKRKIQRNAGSFTNMEAMFVSLSDLATK